MVEVFFLLHLVVGEGVVSKFVDGGEWVVDDWLWSFAVNGG